MFLTAGPLVERMPTRAGAAGASIAQNLLHNLAVVQEKDARRAQELAERSARWGSQFAAVAKRAPAAESVSQFVKERAEAEQAEAARAAEVAASAREAARTAGVAIDVPQEPADQIRDAREAARNADQHQKVAAADAAVAARAATAAQNAGNAASQTLDAARQLADRRQEAAKAAGELFALSREAAVHGVADPLVEDLAEKALGAAAIADAARANIDPAALQDVAARAAVERAVAQALVAKTAAAQAGAAAREAARDAEIVKAQSRWSADAARRSLESALKLERAARVAAEQAHAARASAEDACAEAEKAGVAVGAAPEPPESPDRPTEPGAVPKAHTVEEFYDETRGKQRAFSISILSVILPAAVLILSLWLACWLTSRGHSWPSPVDCQDAFKGLSMAWLADLLTKGDLAGRLRFGAANVVLIVLCVVAIVFGLESTRRVLSVHRDYALLRYPWLGSPTMLGGPFVSFLVLWIAGAAFLFCLNNLVFGGFIGGVLSPFSGEFFNQLGYCAARKFEMAMSEVTTVAGVFVCLAIAALALGAATIAFRFETDDVNGNWSDSYVLREKLNALMTLLFIAAALLVVGNIAFGAFLGWTMQIVDAAKDAKDLLANESGASSKDALLIQLMQFIPEMIERSRQALAHAPMRNAGGEANLLMGDLIVLRPLETALTSFTGAVSSLLLIAAFLPSFWGLIGDIEIAGRTHAAYDLFDRSKGDAAPETPLHVAGSAQVKEWKTKHGLTMSVADLASSFIAVAAPLLSTTVIDISKIAFGH